MLSAYPESLDTDSEKKKKYSNKLSMKALVEKDILMKKQEKEMRKALHFFYVHLSFLFCRKWQQNVNL